VAIARTAGTAHRHRWGVCPVAVREAALVLAMLFAYTRIRLVASDDRSLAEGHARDVLSVERWLHLDVEATLNRVLGALPPLEVAASYWYAALHYTVTPVALVLLYRSRPAEYRRLRTALVVTTAVALVGYVTFPTAPPRLVAGYTDTLAATSSVGWWGAEGSAVRGAGGAVNQFAAMPSMHVGWALWCSLVLWRLARTRGQRALAAAYAPVTALVVVSTANHWLLDVVVGALLMALAWVAVQPRSRQLTDAAVPDVRAVVPVPRSGSTPLPPVAVTDGSGVADVSSAGRPAGPR
jgi:membrane-associated phospholipid phosphatase